MSLLQKRAVEGKGKHWRAYKWDRVRFPTDQTFLRLLLEVWSVLLQRAEVVVNTLL